MQVVRVLLGLAALAVVAGCAVGSPATTVDEARALTAPLEQASSAVGTATLATELLGDDRTTAAVTDTALLDQVHVLEEAADAVATFVPADATGAGWQADALTAVRDAQLAVADARGWANGAGSDEASVVAALDASADRAGGPHRHARRGDRRVKRLLGVALGILTAIGGFLDIGDLVTNAVVGCRFGLSLAWVVVVGVVGICLFARCPGGSRR